MRSASTVLWRCACREFRISIPPLSPDFWEVYGEPVYEFWNAAVALLFCVKTVADLQKPLDALQDGEVHILYSALQQLNALASTVCISLVPPQKMVQSFSNGGRAVCTGLIRQMAVLT